MPSVRSFMVIPKLPQELKDLEFLASNMYWSWNPEVKEIDLDGMRSGIKGNIIISRALPFRTKDGGVTLR